MRKFYDTFLDSSSGASPKAEGGDQLQYTNGEYSRSESPKAEGVEEYSKNNLGDFVIDGKLTIEKLYQLAKKEGFQNRNIFISINNTKTKENICTEHVCFLGKGWSEDSAIIKFIVNESPIINDSEPF